MAANDDLRRSMRDNDLDAIVNVGCSSMSLTIVTSVLESRRTGVMNKYTKEKEVEDATTNMHYSYQIEQE
jgi:hypothetical protein